MRERGRGEGGEGSIKQTNREIPQANIDIETANLHLKTTLKNSKIKANFDASTDLSISDIPRIITDCSPRIIEEDLHTSLCPVGSTHQT